MSEDARIVATRSVRGGIISWDWTSCLVHALGTARLADIENEANSRAFSLALPTAVLRYDVAAWIVEGMPGAEPHADDPVRQRLAGVTFAAHHGELCDIKPAPRRAVGPDWMDAIVGSKDALGVVRAAWLTVFPKHPEQEITYAFSTVDDAAAALARMRGVGVRLFGSAIMLDDVAYLTIRLRGTEARNTASREVAGECARKLGGIERRHIARPLAPNVYAPSEELLALQPRKTRS